MPETEDATKHGEMNLSSLERSTHSPRGRSEQEGSLRSTLHGISTHDPGASAPPTAPSRSDAGIRTEVLVTVLQAKLLGCPRL